MSRKNDQPGLITEPELNDETLQALQQVVERKDLIHAKDAEDFFYKLGLI